ncbi:Zn(2)-C6 fungal-type domain-containing protein [Fusarium sp. LHS14.1]|nr:Zn(2)-C6 fungal-type domain-containing protein [Fusarium sp. LHS14.1]
MVNRGRPSKDCLPCRKRKLRCDLKAGTCGQCQRARLECHGYRNPQDLVFRDQTDVARHKVLARVGVPVLNLDMDTRCRDTFFALYVTGISRSCTSLVPLYMKAPATGHLACSVDAVSLAFAGVQFESQEAMSLASKRYVTALQSLGQALRHPKALRSNQTLQSVLLLDLYEKICGQDPQQPRSWISHIQGAMCLIEARGNFDLSNPIACELARNVVTTLTISCGAVKAPVPESVLLLRRRLDGHVLDTKWEFMNILLDIVNLRADMHNGRWLNHTDEAAERAKGLDRRLVSLEQKLPEDWKPVPCFTVIRHRPPLLLDGYHDAYPNHFVTQLWNTLRAMRLEMTKIIKDHDPNSEAAASKTINSTARKICHAVPQFMLPRSRPENAGPFSPMEKLQCRSLLSHLYLAAQLSADEHLREWICACMEYIAERGEMRVARDIAGIIRGRMDVDYWTVWAMTGCYAMAA